MRKTVRFCSPGPGLLALVLALALHPSLPLAAAQDTSAQDEPGKAAADAGENPLKNTLRWTTATEVDNFGFDVYRGRTKDGPFERVTGDPIPGAGTSDVATRYVYHDVKIEPGVEYYYYVESISMGGERKAFTPVIKAPAKRADGSVVPSPGPAPEAEGALTPR